MIYNNIYIEPILELIKIFGRSVITQMIEYCISIVEDLYDNYSQFIRTNNSIISKIFDSNYIKDSLLSYRSYYLAIFYDIMNSIGYDNNILPIFINIISNCPLYIEPKYNEIIIACCPENVHMKNNVLHNIDDAAITWKNGEKSYYLYGQKVTIELHTRVKNGNISSSDIITERNATLRNILIQASGIDIDGLDNFSTNNSLITQLEMCKKIDSYQISSSITGKICECTLYDMRTERNDIFLDGHDESMKIVTLEDHSTHKVTVLALPSNINSAKGTVA